VAAALALSFWTGCAGRSTSPPEGATVEPPLTMEGVTYSEYSGSRLSHRAQARQLLVAPASFGPFQVAMVHELVLTGVHYDLFLDEACAGGARCLATVLEDPSLGVLRISSLKGGLPLAGAKLLDVTWVLWRGTVPLARFSAQAANVRRRGGSLELRDARLELLATGVVVDAKQAVWEAKTRSFAIRGGYVLQDGEKRSTGEQGRMDFAIP
jgi:hypothetical protein